MQEPPRKRRRVDSKLRVDSNLRANTKLRADTKLRANTKLRADTSGCEGTKGKREHNKNWLCLSQECLKHALGFMDPKDVTNCVVTLLSSERNAFDLISEVRTIIAPTPGREYCTNVDVRIQESVHSPTVIGHSRFQGATAEVIVTKTSECCPPYSTAQDWMKPRWKRNPFGVEHPHHRAGAIIMILKSLFAQPTRWTSLRLGTLLADFEVPFRAEATPCEPVGEPDHHPIQPLCKRLFELSNLTSLYISARWQRICPVGGSFDDPYLEYEEEIEYREFYGPFFKSLALILPSKTSIVPSPKAKSFEGLRIIK